MNQLEVKKPSHSLPLGSDDYIKSAIEAYRAAQTGRGEFTFYDAANRVEESIVAKKALGKRANDGTLGLKEADLAARIERAAEAKPSPDMVKVIADEVTRIEKRAAEQLKRIDLFDAVAEAVNKYRIP